MNSPVDIKAVLDAMGDAEEARNAPVRVHVYLDDGAPRDLASVAAAATRPSAGNAQVERDPFPPGHGIPDASADLAVIVAGAGDRAGALYHDLQAVGVPAAVFAADAARVCEEARAAGAAISADDVIAPDAVADAGALPDRAAGGPIALDSADAEAMLAAFGRWVVAVFKDKRLAFAHAFPCVRRPLALESVNATAVQNAGIGVVVIIPGADMPLMTLNQVKMLLEIAAAYGEDLSFGRVKEILAVVGGAFACRGAARQLVGAVPGIGWAVKGGIGYAGTIAMGHALLEYFEAGGDIQATARNAADTVRSAPAWMGVSPDRGVAGNVRAVADAARDAASRAAGNAARNIGPMAASVARAAGEATGFTKEEVTALAGKVAGAVRGRLGK